MGKEGFFNNFKTMFKVDTLRMVKSSTFYIMLIVSFVLPVLILVMTSMMGGSTTINPETGVETTVEGFTNVWQMLGSSSGGMDIVSMCNINMVYFFIGIFVSLFISQDFSSGFSKNIFTVRSKKMDYVASKIVVCSLFSTVFIILFFLGTLFGGAIAGLSFEMSGFNASNIVACIFSKLFLVMVFVPIFVLVNTFTKQRLWLGILLSLSIGMLLYMMVPLITPITSNIMNVILSFAGGLISSVGFNILGNISLSKISILN